MSDGEGVATAATRDGGGFTAPGRMPPPRPSSAAGAGRPSRTAKPRRRSSLESSAPASATPARASAALEPARLRLALAAAVGLAMAAAAGLRPAIASARRASASPWLPRRQSRAETRRLCSGSPECTAAVLAPAPPSPSRAEQRREAPRGPPPPPRPGSIEGGRVDGRRRSGLGAVRRGLRAEGRPRGAGAILLLVTSASSSPESSRGASPRAGARAEPRSPAGAHRARRGSSRGEPARGPGKAGGGGGGARPVGEQADGGGMGEELARCGSNAVEVRLKKLTCGPHTSVRSSRGYFGPYENTRVCEWVQEHQRRIKWHGSKKRRIVMARFKIRKL